MGPAACISFRISTYSSNFAASCLKRNVGQASRYGYTTFMTTKCFSTAANSTAATATATATTAARTRFAPSPTGFMHLGSLRTALYNYLLAKGTGGSFILRIEDTDEKRTIPEAEAQLMETLKWAGLQWDEGPAVGGEYGPYRQSERAQLYREHAATLLKSGYAYRCFCTEARLRELALRRGETGMASEYDRTCASIPIGESEDRASGGERFVIRLKAPERYPPYHDEVYGTIRPGKILFRDGEPSFEDPILIKSDGQATYHLANVVDDHHMKITHVIRGNEWLISTPKHLYLYKIFGWTPPKFAHVGLLQDSQGRKLSKRNGDVHISIYRDRGYTPSGLLNFLALMGWHNPGRSDVLGLDELVEKFSIGNLSKGDTKVSFEKLTFLQRQHNMSVANSSPTAAFKHAASFVDLVQKEITSEIQNPLPGSETAEYIQQALTDDMKNLTTVPLFVKDHDYLFTTKISRLGDSRKELDKISENLGMDRIQQICETNIQSLKSLAVEDWKPQTIRDAINSTPKSSAEKKMLNKYLRYAICGGKFGASMSEVISLLGKEVTIERLEDPECNLKNEVSVKSG